MKSVLMIGQSNMAGRGFINEVPMICNERIQMLRNGKWQMMTEPINYDRPISGVSLAGSFAAMWCMENKEEQIGLIPCAEGGSSIDDWSIEKILFKNAIIQAKFAMQNSNLIAILWHQGENDSYNGNYKTYYEKLHTIRLQYKDNKVSIYFDNMNKITLNDCGLKAGKIGYKQNDNLEICYTAFSDVAHGSSDNKAIHQNTVLASNYYSSHLTSSKLVVNEVMEGEEEYYNGKVGSYDLSLKNKGDYATYRIYAEEDGLYGLDMTLRKEYEGKKVLVKVDNNDPIRMTIPSSNDCYGVYYTTTIGEINLTKGAHHITIICEDEIRFTKFSYFLSSESYPLFEHSLSEYVETGARYINSWKLKDDGHYALAGNRNLMYFGDETLTDFTLEVDIELVGETQASSCGVILRADNPAFASNDNVSSIQGYYVGFNNSKVFISKCNYNNSNMDTEASATRSDSNVSYHLKVVVRGNKIELDFNNGEVVLTFVDDLGFTHGSLGFYTDGAAAIYRNLKIYK